MTTQTYNGWANWETWNVALWVDNDYGLYQAKRGWCSLWTSVHAEQFAREVMPDGTPDMDETDGGFDAVDWDEIADAWNEE